MKKSGPADPNLGVRESLATHLGDCSAATKSRVQTQPLSQLHGIPTLEIGPCEEAS